MKQAICVDLDGTLCDMSHRLHFIKGIGKKDWKSFDQHMAEDTLNAWCYKIVDLFSKAGIRVIYVTGRSDAYRETTLAWLVQNKCPIDALFMRAAKDNREDTIVKKEIYENEIQGKYDVLFCVEDRASVTKMWRSLGLVCLQCVEGNY
jgi:uncharacterized HAD superfamily protein